MSKHTPGPWKTEGFQQLVGKGTFYGGLIIGADDETIVAQCVMPNDARLIAMSPEMFDVLQAIAGDGLSMYGSPTDMLEKFQDMARTVVAKVTREKE